MKIDSYAVAVSSTSSSVKSYSVTEQIVTGAQTNPAGAQSSGNTQGAVLLSLTPEGEEQSANNQAVAANEQSRPASGFSIPDKYKARLLMVQQLYESLTGRKPIFNVLDNLFINNSQFNNAISLAPAQQTVISLQRTETYYERQEMSFQASGVVNTADGRQITFDMNVMMSYEFYSSNSTAIQQAVQNFRLCDPLVINFDGNLPEFTEDRYSFDLIVGGEQENIFMPTGGSGFLALDKNGNGAIDDGSELFGAATGNGFAELSAYDNDGNGWIDENDAIFEDLKIMLMDEKSGEYVLMSLKDAGVGAIFLGSTANDFEINSSQNETQGVIRRSGFFLYENGNTGTVHHIDLTY
ncbi:MAG: hypothetical protein LBI42_04540 [Chitinispirillales bacterium]|jgi:hypothetical protein|nr:hypothetical protein [Chitinispirillales bacterium]